MRGLIRIVLLLVIVLIVAAYFGYLPQTASLFSSTSGASSTSQQTADELKDRAARTAERVDATLADTALTTKIKAKIALDDTVQSADVRIHTTGGIVTVGGTVHSQAIQQRILQLARETAGVKSVVNETTVAGKS
jgi:hyperosmotically inducible periplasmic protein